MNKDSSIKASIASNLSDQTKFILSEIKKLKTILTQKFVKKSNEQKT